MRRYGWQAAGLAIVAAFSCGSADADVCLAPEMIERFAGQAGRDASRPFDGAPAGAGSCPVAEDGVCPGAGLHLVWSNNDAAYWFGPLGAGADVDRLAATLSRVTRALASGDAGGDYRTAAHHLVAVRKSECFPAGPLRGAVPPQTLYDLGREALRLEALSGEIAALDRDLAELREQAREADPAELARLETAAAALAAESWRAALLPEDGAPAALPLGRIGDGLVHLAVEPAAPVGGEGLDARFAEWVSEALALARRQAGRSSPLQERLALVAYLASPEDIEALAQGLRGQSDDSDGDAGFARLAQRLGREGALLRFRQSALEGGPLARAGEMLGAFEAGLAPPVDARLRDAGPGQLFSLSQGGGEMPPLEPLQAFLASQASPGAVDREIEAELARLGRESLVAALEEMSREIGVVLAAEEIADHLLRADFALLASGILRGLLSQAFRAEGGSRDYIEALAEGDYDAFSGGLLGASLAGGLAHAAGLAESAPETRALGRDMADALIARAPVRAWQRLARAAAASLPPQWRTALSTLADGQAGTAARQAVEAGLLAAGLTPEAVSVLLERGAARTVLDAELARRLGLGSEDIGRLEAGEAPEYVILRAAEGDLELADALRRNPRGTVAGLRRRLENGILADLPPAESLASLADPAIRQAVARALLLSAAERDRLAQSVFSSDAIAALLAGDRRTAERRALLPLLDDTPGAAALVEGDIAPFREAVARALREATAEAMGPRTADTLLARRMLDAIEAGDLERLGREYAQTIFLRSSLDEQTRRLLLTGETAQAWRNEARRRDLLADDIAARLGAISRTLWRARAAHDLSRHALERRERLHGVHFGAPADGEG